jgi:hypothetical protein
MQRKGQDRARQGDSTGATVSVSAQGNPLLLVRWAIITKVNYPHVRECTSLKSHACASRRAIPRSAQIVDLQQLLASTSPPKHDLFTQPLPTREGLLFVGDGSMRTSSFRVRAPLRLRTLTMSASSTATRSLSTCLALLSPLHNRGRHCTTSSCRPPCPHSSSLRIPPVVCRLIDPG